MSRVIIDDSVKEEFYHPASQRFKNRVNFSHQPILPSVFKNNVQFDHKCRSVGDIENDPDNIWDNSIDENQLTIMTLPVELMRRPSLASAKLKRDTQFQGTRVRRNPRAVKKIGDRNVSFKKIRYPIRIFDFVTTLVDELQWRFTLMIFGLSFSISWIIFALCYYLVASTHGDLDFDPSGRRLGEGKMPCINDLKSPASFLLFSIETQNTIGFGRKYPTEECPEAIFLIVFQSIIGVLIEGAMVGIVYAKMTRPAKRSTEKTFSKNAAICLRDGKLCFLFRVCDSRQTHVIGTKVQAFWFDETKTPEGKLVKQLTRNLKLENNGKMLLMWPNVCCHVIDQDSPMYHYSAKDLLEKRFEIVTTITGSSKSTGQLTEARSSYISKEILWGNRFANMLSYDSKLGTYVANYGKFDVMIPVDTPLCSASMLDKIYGEFLASYREEQENSPVSSVSSFNINDLTVCSDSEIIWSESGFKNDEFRRVSIK